MKFKPVEKITQTRVIDALKANFPESKGTVLYLQVMAKIMSSFMDPELTPMERIHGIWFALFVVRAWRKWCISKFNTIVNCVTTNCYWNLEINAHALIKFIILCRENNYEFDVTLLQSQACESFFRQARSFTSTESTVVNFTMNSFEQRLNRIEAKTEIMHRRKSEFLFPRYKLIDRSTSEMQLPPDEDIAKAFEKSKLDAQHHLMLLGMESSDIDFNECVYLRSPKSKPDSECGNFEFVSVAEEPQEDDGSISRNEVYNVSDVFGNGRTDMIVKDSSAYNTRNTFKLRYQNGKVVTVKKSTFVWTVKSDPDRCSTDRNYRFRGNSKTNSANRFKNQRFETVIAGEWILIKCEEERLVCKVYGFQYLSGDNLSYTSNEAPVMLPDGATARGIGVRGSYFQLIKFDDDYMLELHDNSTSMCYTIANYQTHLENPYVHTGLMFFTTNTVTYVDSFLTAEL